jgi:hypothetical protein
VQSLEAAGLQNLFRLTPRIYSGSAPEGDAGFESLTRLGIKTIITVDGTKPDIEAAHRHGFRYVHLPHGYDGIPFQVGQQLAKAAATRPGPIYVHCHHGKHRGPAAAALMCEATAGWTHGQALEWLKLAGTSSAYPGLFESAERFRPPTEAELAAIAPHFVETAATTPLVDTMVAIDAVWDRLKPLAAAGSAVLPPDAAADATLLWEHFRELRRTLAPGKGDADFVELLARAESAADRLRSALVSRSRPDFSPPLHAVGEACADCHKAHRDPARERN